MESRPFSVRTRRGAVRSACAVLGATALMALSACSVIGAGDDAADPATQTTGSASGSPANPTVVLVTHESFNLPEELLAQFTRETGYRLKVNQAGDAGTLATKLALTADNPTGDVVFGLDNTYATRPLSAGAFAPYDGPRPSGSQTYDLATGADQLVPIDTAAVCVNVDTAWFAEHDLAAPTTLEDLTEPEYRDLFVTPAPTTSSPGMAFLLATVAAYGDEWPAYWSKLFDNGALSVKGWSDAYYSEFTAGGDAGKRPIVVSYDSSPAFTLSKDKKSSTTAALLDTCFNQVEYAGVLAGAKNPAGAEAAVEFLASDEVQAALPDSMYVFPTSDAVEVPTDWARFAVRPSDPFTVTPDEIAENREQWLVTWTDLASR